MTTLNQKLKKQQHQSKFKSKFEDEVAHHYNLVDKYETESITYTLENKYTPDFKLSDRVFLECKGFFKPSDRRKMLEVMQQHPNTAFVLFFQNSQVKIAKNSKTSYADWCDKNNIQWFCWKTKRPTRRVLSMVASHAADKLV